MFVIVKYCANYLRWNSKPYLIIILYKAPYLSFTLYKIGDYGLEARVKCFGQLSSNGYYELSLKYFVAFPMIFLLFLKGVYSNLFGEYA